MLGVSWQLQSGHSPEPYLAGVLGEFGGSQKGRSLISAYQISAITTNTPGFEKLNTALIFDPFRLYL